MASPTFALRPVSSPSLSPTMHPSQESSAYEGSVTNAPSSSGGEHNGRASIFAGEEEPRGTKVSERPGWVTVIVNRKRGQLEVPTEEYEEWLDAVTKDDAPRRKKILNKWGGRRRTMDRRESGFKPPAAAEADNSGASSTSSPPPAVAALPPLSQQPRRHSTSTPYLPPISSVGPLPPLRASPPSPPYYQSSYKRPRHHYDYPPSSDYSDPNGVKRQRSSLQLPPLSFDADRSRHDRMYWEPPVSSTPYNRLSWDELKSRYDHQVSMLERDGLELEIASAQSRKCEIDFLNDEADLGDAEVMYATMTRKLETASSPSNSHDAARIQEEVDYWSHEVEKRRRRRDISHDSMMRTRAEIDISARACTLGRMEIEKTRDAMMDVLIRLRPHPPRP